MQNCVVVTTTDDGLISRIDEYVDPTVGAQLT
jgi:ketosteroid isomerase-like protein